MIKRKLTKDESGTIDLVETYSDENFKLKQVETDRTYGSHVIDVIAGYDEDNIPYPRFTYIETDEKDEPYEPTPESELEDTKNALNILGVE